MKLAIMQPYFFPYLGYFQLIAAADMFIVYDNIKYTKKGWINRNRMLQNGKDVVFSLPLKSDSHQLNVCQRELATDFSRDKLLNQLSGAYRRAPYFDETIPLLESIVQNKNSNLFQFLHHSIVKTCEHLGITTEIKRSSSIVIDHDLKNQDKVLALCKAVSADTYVNAIGGIELYSKDIFLENQTDLKFIRSKQFIYKQFGEPFVNGLSIIDVLMFNPIVSVKHCVATNFELI